MLHGLRALKYGQRLAIAPRIIVGQRYKSQEPREPINEIGSREVPFTGDHPQWSEESLKSLGLVNVYQLRTPHEFAKPKNIRDLPHLKDFAEWDRMDNPHGIRKKKKLFDTMQVPNPIVPEKGETAPSLVSSVLDHDGTCKRFEMNRTEALNALDLKFTTEIRRIFQHYDVSPSAITFMAHTVTGGSMFCPGTDLRAILNAGRGSNYTREFYHGLYNLASVINTVKKVAFCVLDGPTFGSASVFLAGNFGTTTLSTVFAVPDCLIGFFPDGGIIHKLAPLNEMGRYIALTGRRINYADMHKIGLAKYHIDTAEQITGVQTALGQLVTEDVYRTMSILNVLPIEPPNEDLDAYSLTPVEHLVKRVFKKKTIRLMMTELEKIYSEPEGGPNGPGAQEWAARTLKRMKKANPFSLQVTLEYLNMVIRERLSFDDCLAMDFRLSQRFVETDDYWEGVKYACEKNRSLPNWKYKTIEDVPMSLVKSFFRPFADPRKEFKAIESRPDEDVPDWNQYYKDYRKELTVPVPRPRIIEADGSISLGKVPRSAEELTASELADIPTPQDIWRAIPRWRIACYKLDFAIRHVSYHHKIDKCADEFKHEIMYSCYTEMRKFITQSFDVPVNILDRATDVMNGVTAILKYSALSTKDVWTWVLAAKDIAPIIASNLVLLEIMLTPVNVSTAFRQDAVNFGYEIYDRGLISDIDYVSH